MLNQRWNTRPKSFLSVEEAVTPLGEPCSTTWGAVKAGTMDRLRSSLTAQQRCALHHVPLEAAGDQVDELAGCRSDADPVGERLTAGHVIQ
jgi:hypothetical protein